MIPKWVLPGLSGTALVAVVAGAVMGQAAKPVARVNGEVITVAEVEAILKVRPLRFIQLTESDRREMQREALDMLIDDLVAQQFLRKHAPAVPPSEVNRKLSELQASLKSQGRTMDDYCRETGQTEAQVRSSIVSMLQRHAYITGHLSDATVRKYYEENREFFDQVTVRASHILLRLATGSTPEERATARARLRGLRQEILAGKLDFVEAAKQHSQCPSAPNGGDIGYLLRKGAVEESFATCAFAMNQGEISDVVQTNYGLHLIKVTERKAGSPSDFKKIAEKVRELAGEEMMLRIVARQRAGSQVEVLADEGQRGRREGRKSGR